MTVKCLFVYATFVCLSMPNVCLSMQLCHASLNSQACLVVACPIGISFETSRIYVRCRLCV